MRTRYGLVVRNIVSAAERVGPSMIGRCWSGEEEHEEEKGWLNRGWDSKCKRSQMNMPPRGKEKV